MGMQKIDTSPKIAVYGKYLRNATRIESDAGWCYTEWVECNQEGQTAGTAKYIVDAFASCLPQEGIPHSFQFETSDGLVDYWYNPNNNFEEYRRKCGSKNIVRVRWSLLIANIDKCYAFLENTGQIFFAGKNSIYFGHRNISELT